MTNNESFESDSPQEDDEGVAGVCKACGNKFWAVNQTEYDRIIAGHVLDDHADQASEELLEECRELVEVERAD